MGAFNLQHTFNQIKSPDHSVPVRIGPLLQGSGDNGRGFLCLEGGTMEQTQAVRQEKIVTMGLKSLKALGEALVCIGVAQSSVVLDEGTLGAMGNLIFDQADAVCQALGQEV